MSFLDILRMSSSSLWRRKFRTFLTVLGVVIGTAAIVVMVSLGLGLQESLYREAEQSGGLTNIQVSMREGRPMEMGGTVGAKKPKYITDEVIRELSGLEHVQGVHPVLNVSGKIISGKYEANVQLTGMKQEGLRDRKLPLLSGRLPAPGGNLEVIFGNNVIMDFHKKGQYNSMEMGMFAFDGEMQIPEINFEKDNLFLSIETYNDQSEESNPMENQGKKPVRKYILKTSGMLEGKPDEWTPYGGDIYCDLDSLVRILKKQKTNGIIQGQPQKKDGKPLPFFVYSSANVRIDKGENVEAVSKRIKDLGYEVYSNMEFINSMKKQMAMIQAVLGAIGAVSLFVAAIGITNTMMMSIYERTKEIGVIKVLGCSLNNIRQMFLTEAAAIGLLGGIIGNILSLSLSGIINLLTKGQSQIGGKISVIPVWLVLVSIVFAILIGMIAGYFPARKAMNLSALSAMGN